jgi:hypothetical protein
LLDDLREMLGGERQFEEGGWPFPHASEFVLWKEHWKHLEEFEGVCSPSSADGRGLDARINDLLNGISDIQLHLAELRPIVEAVQSRPACSLLVFGCGNDSVFWERVNQGGTTVFLEDDPGWAEQVRSQLKESQVFSVEYGTTLGQWESLLHTPDLLALDLPQQISSRHFDVIVVDGPAGHERHVELTGRDAPGRMKSIYTASTLVAPGGFVFVHDCDRDIEQRYATEHLGAERLFLRVEGRSVLQGYEF